MKRSQIDMINGRLLPDIIRFAIPVMLTGFIQMCFNAADMAVVGRFCGSIAVAAVGSTSSLSHLIINLFLGLSMGSGVTVARATGAGDEQEVSDTVHTAVLLSVIFGAFLTVVGIVVSPTMLAWMDTPGKALELASVYLRVYFAGAIPMLVYNFGAAILRAVGDSKRPMIYGILGGGVNVVLNLLFVVVFNWGVAGVAIATSLSNLMIAVLVIRELMHRTDACCLIPSKLKIHKTPLKSIIRIGLPSGLQNALFAISNVTIQSSINSFGEEVLAGSSAAANLEAVIWFAQNGFHQATVNFCGQNMGARNYRRLRKVAHVSLACNTVASAVLAVLFNLFGRQLLGIYIPDSPAAIEYGMVRVALLCSTYVLDGYMAIMSNGLRGIGKSTSAMFVTLGGVCGFRLIWIFTVFKLPQYHTLTGLFIAYPISWILTFVVGYVWFMIATGKLIKQNSLEVQKA
ncbi:MAG: MATE family efflux transporter [Clostridia bacterium]|nr:MATE family efflux transporter [Clostridia bacterium]